MAVKSGLRTTEFWATLLVVAGNVVASFAGSLPPKYAGIAAAVVTGLYAISRGLAKQTKPAA